MTSEPLPIDKGSIETCACSMMARDNSRMRRAGCSLAEAAQRVIRDYDGLHRLSLALVDWNLAIANEGDRPHPKGCAKTLQQTLSGMCHDQG